MYQKHFIIPLKLLIRTKMITKMFQRISPVYLVKNVFIYNYYEIQDFHQNVGKNLSNKLFYVKFNDSSIL